MIELPPIAEPYLLPFHYGALHNLGIDYLVDPEAARDVLSRVHPGLEVAEFGGKACVSVNFQLYFAQYPGGGGITNEIEINIIAYPRGQEHRLPAVSYQDYVSGVDQSKLLGIGRIHVLCDNAIAIDAGTKLFAEPKFPATFTAEMPSPNGPEGDSWTITCHDGDTDLFTLFATLDGLTARPVSPTVTGYGTTSDGRLLAGPMNVYQPYRFYSLTADTVKAAGIEVLAPDSASGRDLSALIGDNPAAGVWTHQSAPVAAHNRPYFVPAG